jgi:hypothetical protein
MLVRIEPNADMQDKIARAARLFTRKRTIAHLQKRVDEWIGMYDLAGEMAREEASK